MKISLSGNKSIKSLFDSQVVRLDVIAPRVVGLDVSVREWSGWMLFRKFLRVCGQVGCMHKLVKNRLIIIRKTHTNDD